jgi:hypothetical protein
VRRGAPGRPGNHDFSTSRAGIVPRDQRRPMWHLMGLWTTLVAGFSFMVPGFVMYDGGLRRDRQRHLAGPPRIRCAPELGVDTT